MNDKVLRMKKLISILNEASRAYYQLSEPIMTDYDYDKLYDELVSLEQETNTILSNSPTINVETEVSDSLKKVVHPEPMLSLSKTKVVSELVDFIGDQKGILSWKLDGLTIVLTYRDGKFVQGVTRGNGFVGEDITENVRQFRNIPFSIPYKGELVLRGEAVIKYSDFNRMNGISDTGELQYKNPRNLCSGSVRQLDSKITRERFVNCYIFALISASDDISNSKSEQYSFLESLGFDVVERTAVDKYNLAESVLWFKDKVKTYDIPSDGLVLTYDDVIYGMSLGITAKYPKHSIAFKWNDETVETRLIDIDWSASRTGLINPVAVFEPVEIEGTVVSRASVHNISILEGLKLGIGDAILVYKANMIIPQIADNITKSNNVCIPSVCPVCFEKTSIKEINNIKYLYCDNDFCHAKFIKKLSLFTSRNAMNIDGISDSILMHLFSEGFINDYVDLYHLDRYKDDIINYDGFGVKSYNNMINSINKSRKVRLANFIYALGIKEIGLSRAKLICRYCNNDFKRVRNINFSELASIDGIGDVIANEWIKAFNNSAFIDSLNKLLLEVEFISEFNQNMKLAGLNFVITGSLFKFNNRDELIELIESFGGKVTSSVSSKVNYLINNDINSNSAKNKKAKELNIPIISESDFELLINN